ncbi:MAG: hypothetical protein FJ011_28715 [Chloroflexi bacterium]|nr:hypothetical protein [Chloroflexota bacterium]
MPEYVLPIAYDPARGYTAAQVGVRLAGQMALLCWFAEQSGYDPCILGVDFEAYDAVAGALIFVSATRAPSVA